MLKALREAEGDTYKSSYVMEALQRLCELMHSAPEKHYDYSLQLIEYYKYTNQDLKVGKA